MNPTRTTPPRLHWHWGDFDSLSLRDLHDALQLRARVFILEQGPYLDVDGLDPASHHLLGRLAEPWGELPAGELVVYLRAVAPGLKYAEPALGRVVCHAGVRGTGLGRALVAEGLRGCEQVWPGQGNRISAQAHLGRFYGEFGYQPVGEVYLEDDIPHLQMLRPAAGVASG